MKPFQTVPLAVGLLVATASGLLAQDTDGDGMVSIAEIVAVYPDVTPEAFGAADTNGDGMLDAEEMTAAQEAGLIPAGEM